MAGPYDHFFVDPATRNEGVWVRPRPDADYRMRVRYAGRMRRDATAAMAEMHAEIAAARGASDDAEIELTDEEEEQFLVDFIVRFVLVDWEGVTDRQDRDLPFTTMNARQLLADLPDLARWLWARSQDQAYLNDLVEGAAGN